MPQECYGKHTTGSRAGAGPELGGAARVGRGKVGTGSAACASNDGIGVGSQHAIGTTKLGVAAGDDGSDSAARVIVHGGEVGQRRESELGSSASGEEGESSGTHDDGW